MRVNYELRPGRQPETVDCVMARQHHYLGFVDDDAHFALDDKAAFRTGLQDFKGQEVVLTVQPRSVLRSLRANNYYWGVVVAAAVKESGQDEAAIHTFWCEQFLPDERKRLMFFNRLTGQRLQVDVDTRRSSNLTGNAFYDFVENCRLWLQEYLNVTVPDPDPEYWRKRAKETVA